MSQTTPCPRCFAASPPQANFCRRCGLEISRAFSGAPRRRRTGRMVFWAGPLFILTMIGFFHVNTSVPPAQMQPFPQSPALPSMPPSSEVDPNFFQPVRIPDRTQQDNRGYDNYHWPLPPDRDKMSRRSEP